MELPLRLESETKWPWRLFVLDHSDEVLLIEERQCHSSRDKTLDDVVSARNFGPENRKEAADANAAQIELFQSLIRACNSHDALVSALRSSRQYIQLAIIDGKKAGLSEDTLNIARRDLDALDAALASTKESEHD